MWPSSTFLMQSLEVPTTKAFQSLKRDVAFFHTVRHFDSSVSSSPVSIAQARCGLLPRNKLNSIHAYRQVSIAQARCGLLPPGRAEDVAAMVLAFQSLKRDVAFFHAIVDWHNPGHIQVSIAQA